MEEGARSVRTILFNRLLYDWTRHDKHRWSLTSLSSFADREAPFSSCEKTFYLKLSTFDMSALGRGLGFGPQLLPTSHFPSFPFSALALCCVVGLLYDLQLYCLHHYQLGLSLSCPVSSPFRRPSPLCSEAHVPPVDDIFGLLSIGFCKIMWHSSHL